MCISAHLHTQGGSAIAQNESRVINLFPKTHLLLWNVVSGAAQFPAIAVFLLAGACSRSCVQSDGARHPWWPQRDSVARFVTSQHTAALAFCNPVVPRTRQTKQRSESPRYSRLFSRRTANDRQLPSAFAQRQEGLDAAIRRSLSDQLLTVHS